MGKLSSIFGGGKKFKGAGHRLGSASSSPEVSTTPFVRNKRLPSTTLLSQHEMLNTDTPVYPQKVYQHAFV